MILHQIQQQLESLYQTETKENVEHFLVTAPAPKFKQESLLVKYTSGELAIGLFIAPKILNTLQNHNPFSSFDGHNLKAFLIAVEGVSHFVYLLKKASENNPVTQLELELQAEIDKYLLACFLFTFHRQAIPPFLFSYLFEEMQWQPSLTRKEKWRYKEANRFATKFCTHLDQQYIRYGYWTQLIETARHFYRLNHWDKIRLLTP